MTVPREAAHEQRKPNMSTSPTMKRIIAGALLSGGVAVAGLGLAAPAQAGPSYWHYCPGHWETRFRLRQERT